MILEKMRYGKHRLKKVLDIEQKQNKEKKNILVKENKAFLKTKTPQIRQ